MSICKFILAPPAYWKALKLSFPLLITLTLIRPLPAHACKAAPGSKPASIAQRIKKTPHVFKGTVLKVKDSVLTIRVNQTFKGSVPKIIQLDGFNMTSCDTRITTTGETFLFFAKANAAQPWNAVYDGAFGAVSGWSKSTIADLKKLGLKIK
jgi:hypothetical protein